MWLARGAAGRGWTWAQGAAVARSLSPPPLLPPPFPSSPAPPRPHTRSLYVVLSVGTALKAGLYALCRAAGAAASAAGARGADTLAALAEDHLNDVWSNTAPIVTAVVAARVRGAWWVDPAGGVAISVLIIARWAAVTWEQTKRLTGYRAPPEFVAQVEALAARHSSHLSVDVTRCYHFGSRYNVEMEIVLPADMTVAESHDIALALQVRGPTAGAASLGTRIIGMRCCCTCTDTSFPTRGSTRSRGWRTWSARLCTSTTWPGTRRSTRLSGGCC